MISQNFTHERTEFDAEGEGYRVIGQSLARWGDGHKSGIVELRSTPPAEHNAVTQLQDLHAG
jgi:hypothetical protein